MDMENQHQPFGSLIFRMVIMTRWYEAGPKTPSCYWLHMDPNDQAKRAKERLEAMLPDSTCDIFEADHLQLSL